MKKLFALFVITAGLFSAAAAQQTVASEFYHMKNSADAAFVLKAINMELNLPEAEYKQVEDLITRSATSQQEVEKRYPDGSMTSSIVARQSAHIENNLKNILSEREYALYLQKKAAMVAHLAELKAGK